MIRLKTRKGRAAYVDPDEIGALVEVVADCTEIHLKGSSNVLLVMETPSFIINLIDTMMEEERKRERVTTPFSPVEPSSPFDPSKPPGMPFVTSDKTTEDSSKSYTSTDFDSFSFGDPTVTITSDTVTITSDGETHFDGDW